MRLFEIVVHDIRHALRSLRRTPGFTLTVVLTLALAAGTNTAIFSVVDQLLLRPLPYPDGDRVVRIYDYNTRRNARADINPGNWLDWQRQSRTFEALAAWDPASVTLNGVGEPARLDVLRVSSEFFPLLDVPPLLGRVISDSDDRPNMRQVAVLSYELWQLRFAGDPRVVGRIIQLNELPTEVVGVMPARFRFIPESIDLWVAFQLDRSQDWRNTNGRFMSVVGRIKNGTTLDAARTDMRAIASSLESKPRNDGVTAEVVPLREEIVGDVRAPVLMVYGAVVMLLAIGCLNVANLMLARSMSRTREIAVRATLGASRGAIARPFLVESGVLALCGAGAGIVVAQWSLRTLGGFVPAEVLPVNELRLDGRLIGYVLAVSFVMGALIGFMPALLITSRSIAAILRSQSARITQASRLRHVLVVGQVAMTVVLLCGAGLLLRTVTALNATDAGFARQGLLTMEIQLPAARYDPAGRVDFFRRARQRLAEIAGVESVSAAQGLPVVGAITGRTSVDFAGQPVGSGVDRPSATIRVVSPGYFKTIGTPVVQGREFVEADMAADAPLVFVVNEAFLNTLMRGRDPLTTSISVGMQRDNPFASIVGVVGDVSEGSLWDSAEPTVFYNHKQLPSPAMVLLIRAAASTGLARTAVEAIHELDANLAIANIRTVDGALAESIARERLVAVVSTTFAIAGLLLAALGLYGLLAFVVSERTKELGVRIALGAQVGGLMRSVLAGGLRLVIVGAVLGIAVALSVSRFVSFMFYGIGASDAWTYVGVLTLLTLVTVAATLLPAYRAATVDPTIALRAD